jgi:hypothetical protein
MTDDISAWGEAPEPDDDETADTFDLGGPHLGGFDAGDRMPDLEGDDGFGPADGFEPDDGTAEDGTGDDGTGDDGTGDDGTGDDGTGDDGMGYRDDGSIAATFEEPLDDASDSVPSHAVPSDGDLADADGEAGLGPADDTTLDATADAESIVGADPDAGPYADGAWPAPEFPAALDLVPPVPVDGFPWADPDTLGDVDALLDADPADPGTDPTALSADLADDLAAYAGGLGTDWAGLAASDDPATAALARFWAPPDR